jgi:hypothetical protein
MKRLRENFHMLHYGTSYTERLTKQYIGGKEVESDFEERGQYEANLQEETKLRLPICEAGKKCCALSIHYSKANVFEYETLFKTAITQDVMVIMVISFTVSL